jgi:EmrB/QacA subfamily drug resistance transporter
MFMVTLDFFIVNVAIPSVQTGLGASAAQIQAIVAGFGVAYAAGMITGGRLGDLYGRKRMLMIGMIVFVLASVTCGLAPSAGWLIAGRVLQGVGAAILSPQVLALLNLCFTGPQRTKAFTAFALSIGFGATFGQLIGGSLIAADAAGLGWRSIFLINVPIGAVALVVGARCIPESRGNGRTGLDVIGTVLVTAGLVAIVLPLIAGREEGWPVWSRVLLIAAVPLLGGFVAYQRLLERTGRAPLVAPSLFAERSFTAGLGIIMLFFSSMASFFLVLALYLQEGHHLSPLASGLVFAATGLGYFLSSTGAPAMAARLGRQVLSAGAVVVAAGFALLAATAHDIGAAGPAPWLGAGLFVALAGAGATIPGAFITSLMILAVIQLLVAGLVQLLARTPAG